MNKIKVMLASAVALFAVASLSAQTVDDVNKLFNEAAALINAKNYAAAIPALDKVVDMGLNVPDAIETVQKAQKYYAICHYMNGMNSLKANNMEAALESLNSAAQTGELYGDITTMGKAKAVISKVYTQMGGKAYNDKDYAKAVEIFSKGYAANPNDTKLGLYLARSYSELGDLDKAGEVYTKIMGLTHSKYAEDAKAAATEYATALNVKSSALTAEDKTEEALANMDKTIEIFPKDSVAHMMRLQTLTNKKNYDKVIEYGEAAAESHVSAVGKSNAYFLLGAAYQNKENKAKAIETYKKVTEGDNVKTAKEQIALLSK